MYYLSPIFINFYRGMGLLTTVEQKQFLLETKVVNDEETLGDNEVASEKYDSLLALPSVKDDKLEDKVEKRARRWLSEEEGSTECSKAASQSRITSAEWAEIEAEIGTEKERTLAFGVKTFGGIRGRKRKSKEVLRRYLDGKMAKYAKPAIAGFYMELVRSRTRAKVAASANVAERVICIQHVHADLTKRDHFHAAESAAKAKKLAHYEVAKSLELEQREKLDADCNKMRSQLSTVEKQLIAIEAKLLEVEGKNQQLADQTDEVMSAKVNRCLHGYVEWEIKTLKWMKLRELEHCVTTLIACSVGGHRQLGRKLDSFISGLEETK
ncbi:hypothetical protein AXG93_2100s1010 [Marchantia polymorpha subsp. ruderalis]|uniref:Uncharacterized protein n=1 Tax=Marchantia polymorpha subsp. ruderalis TaxID=1480154 RepID=A0A176VR88_MARPO|nr:hypothetical protein AXG93_2100s1010 [Marchantia polymorpha subsp. ruderalis]